MKIVIPDDYQYATRELACLELLDSHEVRILGDLSKEPDAATVLAEAEGLVLIRERTRIDRESLGLMPNLKLISQTGKAGRHIDVAACTAAGVVVLEGAGSPIAPAELTWALIMASRRKLVQAVIDMRRGEWQTNIGSALHGQTLGVWGYGKIGRLVARFGRAFGMEVQVWGREGSRRAAESDGYKASPSRESFFESSDVLTLHLRLVGDTTGMILGKDFERMKPSALFVNTSRSELVEPGALEAALGKGRPGFAALDVFPEEPIYDPAHPMLNMPNVLCTPHLGYVEKNGYELYFRKAFENILDFLSGNHSSALNEPASPSGPIT
ncbi:MAG TPA: D-2-hydroxyacid dehydrogenase family protein [Blastocatellia bacterium]|nr:D-2-hydroxyacid dehydrogenase family protein [Blastocatellia bacterium]